jgi:hypothetical protein
VNASSAPDRLADQRYVTVVLRLLLDRHDRLIRGEVGGAPEGPWVRFAEPSGLLDAVQTWLRQAK